MAGLDDFFNRLSQWVLGPRKPTNADTLIGMAGIVIEEINPLKSTGRVMVAGVNWMAKSSTGKPIASGETIRVLGIAGASLIVVAIT